jgi:hypothetical protein
LSLIIPAVIYFIIPACGLVLFLVVRASAARRGIGDAPVRTIFLLFVSYGGLLLILLTDWLWYWSGMASLGVAFLIFVATPTLLLQTIRLWRVRRSSSYHFTAWIMAFAFPLIFALYVGFVVFVQDSDSGSAPR